MIASTAGIFDYQNKYQPGGAQEIFPAEITSQQTRQLQQTALAAHQALKLADYSRADFIWDDHGQLWCLEINTTPGLTANSLLPKSAQAAGLTFDELCEQICQLALARVKN
jgi:D-alanine-D-alanine ligase